MDSIEAALADIESLKPGEKLNYAKIAKKHGVNRVTLSKRHRGIQRSRQDQYENQRIFNNQQSKELIKWINNLTERGLPPSQSMLRNFAKEITGNKPGKCWPNRFLKKHNDELISSYAIGIDSSRKRLILPTNMHSTSTLWPERLRNMGLNLEIYTIWMRKVFSSEYYQKAKESFHDAGMTREGSNNNFKMGIGNELLQLPVFAPMGQLFHLG